MPQIMSLEGPHLGASAMRMGRSGPVVSALHGVFDPITTRPWIVVFGIGLGMWLAGSERGKKLTKSYGFSGPRRRRRR